MYRQYRTGYFFLFLPQLQMLKDSESTKKKMTWQTTDPEFRQRDNERVEVLRKKRFEGNVEAARAKSRETSRRHPERKQEAMQSKRSERGKPGSLQSPRLLAKLWSEFEWHFHLHLLMQPSHFKMLPETLAWRWRKKCLTIWRDWRPRVNLWRNWKVDKRL